MRVEPLEGRGFGAIVTDFEAAMIDDPTVRRLLWQLWVDKGLVVFRGFSADPEVHVRLSWIFGELEIHPVDTSHAGEHGELIDISYRPEDGNVYEVDGKVVANWQPWHSDLAFTVGRNRGGILRPLVLPKHGGKTGFIDAAESHDRLPDALKQRIEGLHVIYQLELDSTKIRFGTRPTRRLSASNAVIRAMEKTWLPVSHPLVFVHPDNGRKILNFSLWHALAVKELPGAEGGALLEDVAGYAGDESRAYDHMWELDEMVLWDNWRMLHCSRGMPMPGDEPRHLQRTTIAGAYPFGRDEAVASAAEIGI